MLKPVNISKHFLQAHSFDVDFLLQDDILWEITILLCLRAYILVSSHYLKNWEDTQTWHFVLGPSFRKCVTQ